MARSEKAAADLGKAVAIVGIPFDLNSTFMRGSALAPARSAVHSQPDRS